MLNQLLGGRYRVIKQLGRGGLAQTYIVEDNHRPSSPKCVAKFLKPVDKDPNFLPTARRLFLQEAEILEKLGQHDQIPRLLAYFEQNEEFFLIQEFIDGDTLGQELKSGHRWSQIKVIQMLQDVLPILEFVHRYGVIHRDIKPNNLIRRKKDGRLVLIDFGIVKKIHASKMMTNQLLSQKTISIGTQGYMPNEQLRGKPGLNSDIYALGIICIQALTGVIPIDLKEDRNGEIIWQNLVEVSDELAAILNKMICYHFLDRYQSATEVLQAIKSLTNEDFNSAASSITTQIKPQIFPENKKNKSTNLSSNLELIRPTAVTQKLQPTLAHEVIFSSNFVTRDANPQIFPENKDKKSSASPSNLELIRPTAVTQKREPTLAHEVIFSSNFVTKNANPQILPENKDRKSSASPSNLELIRPTAVTQKREPTLAHEAILSSNFVTRGASPQLILEEKEKDSLIVPVSSYLLPKDLEPICSLNLVPINKSLLRIGAAIVSGFVTLFVGYTYTSQKLNNLKAQQVLGQIEALKATQKYQECLQEAQAFTQTYPRQKTAAQTFLDDCQNGLAEVQITQAKELSKDSRFKDAIVLAQQIGVNSDFYSEAQQLISQWSEEMVKIASNQYQQGNLKQAIGIASAIPVNNSWGQKAEQSIQQWNQEWTQNQSNLQVAQKAIDEKRWQDAINEAKKINNNAYWQKQSEQIIQKATAEMVKYQQANAFVKTNKSRSISSSVPRSRSSYSRNKSVRRSRSSYSRNKSVRRSRSNYTRSKSSQRYRRRSSRIKSVRRLRSYSTYSRSRRIKSPSSSARPRTNNWACLNNPRRKCRR